MFFVKLVISDHPRNPQQGDGIHHNINSHWIPQQTTSQGNSRFTFSLFALSLALNWCVRFPKSPFPCSVEFTAEEKNALSLAWACCSEGGSLKKGGSQPPGGRMALWGWTGAEWGQPAQRRHRDPAQKQIYGWARRQGKLELYHHETPVRLLTYFQRNSHTEIGALSLSKGNIPDGDKN